MELAVSSLAPASETPDAFFALGMMQSSGHDGPVDLIAAHKWFNIAAARGHKDAAELRREIAAQMSDSEIGQAQRAARDWLKSHPLPAVSETVRIAA
jgi:TPR repeat protein